MDRGINNTNILYLTKTMNYGGTEKVIMQLCENLTDNFNNIVVCSTGGVHEDKLNQLGIKHYKIGDFDNKSLSNIFKTVIEIRRIVKEESINIIHSHHRMGTFYAKIISAFTGCKVVHTAHNTFTDKKLFTKFALSNVDIIAVGANVKKNLVDYFNLDKSKVQVIYNGIAKEKFEPNEVKEIAELKEQGYFIVGNIGRLSEQKGFKYFIDAISEVAKVNDKIRFIIVGDGELKDELVNQCRQLNVDKYVKFLGFRKDVLNIINQLDIVVLSSLWEGLPLTPIEVFSQGKTIIATNVDGTPEIVADGYNGILVNPKNSDDICKSIVNLYNNNDLISEYGVNGFNTYLNKFTLERMIENYKKYYMEYI
ncbi:glycosyl transferase family 1 [Clostridium polyendosporum]|uniref:Glycosyl transferase family 1 n=1 Tax=Clostridium polyendosporum TaxID=69208 RepID=A0A919S2H5_9CLOT|nr:glycosyltransferase family 4 protein [Clostridium polyendosporum]GIM30259.1 glycosyl transferase family 1 [Clostridium polyendosporum]